jgi:hypothetical protein
VYISVDIPVRLDLPLYDVTTLVTVCPELGPGKDGTGPQLCEAPSRFMRPPFCPLTFLVDIMKAKQITASSKVVPFIHFIKIFVNAIHPTPLVNQMLSFSLSHSVHSSLLGFQISFSHFASHSIQI